MLTTWDGNIPNIFYVEGNKGYNIFLMTQTNNYEPQ